MLLTGRWSFNLLIVTINVNKGSVFSDRSPYYHLTSIETPSLFRFFSQDENVLIINLLFENDETRNTGVSNQFDLVENVVTFTLFTFSNNFDIKERQL